MVAGSSSLLDTNIRKPCGGTCNAFWSVVAIFYSETERRLCCPISNEQSMDTHATLRICAVLREMGTHLEEAAWPCSVLRPFLREKF